jgi:hypothetical protein
MKRSIVGIALVAVMSTLGGCATSMSDVHPMVPDGSQGDIALGLDRSVAFDYTVDGSGNVTGSSPIHVEKARGSQVFMETTGGFAYLGQAFAGAGTGYRQFRGTWNYDLNHSGQINQHVSGGTYNEHDHYGNVNVNHGGTVNHDVNGYVYHEHEHYRSRHP